MRDSSEIKKTVLWVADFGIRHNQGGAQRSDSIIISEGRKTGMNITEFNYDVNPAIFHNKYDVIVTANLESISRQHPEIINHISCHPNHFRLEHDANRYLHQDQRKTLFGSCRKSFFLTNFHHAQFVESYGDIFPNVSIIPDPIDTSVFFNQGIERSADSIYTGFMHELKGTKNFIEHALDNPTENFKVAAWGDRIFEFIMKKLDNVEFYGSIPFSEMPSFYNSNTSMFYRPEFYEPFCRSVGEAILCGVKIIGNDKIGCLHYFNEVGIDKFREECANAPKNFWRVINESI